MPDEAITIEVDAEALQRALERAPNELRRQLSQAGRQAAQTVLRTEGLRNYPAQRPPKDPRRGYTRGRGSYYIRADGSRKQYYNSERAGSHWNVRTTSDYKTIIGNRVSYAPYLYGTKGKTGDIGQSIEMGKRGWRQIWEVAQQKVREITRIYEAWIERALMRSGLK